MFPSAPRPIRIVFVLATIASLLAFPVPSLAAPRGTEAHFDVVELVTEVSPGRRAAFEVQITNTGNATWNDVAFTGTLSAGTFVAPLPQPCVLSETTSEPTVECALGTFTAGQPAILRFQVDTPATGNAVTLDGVLMFDSARSNPKAASRDTIPAPGEAPVEGTVLLNGDSDFVGFWQAGNTALETSTLAIGPGNPQSAAVAATGLRLDDYAVMIEEVDQLVCGQEGFGEAVDMSIAGGAPIQPYLTIELIYDANTARGKSPANTDFVHSTDCTIDFTLGCDEGEVNCFDAWWEGNGPSRTYHIVARTLSNGVAKGF